MAIKRIPLSQLESNPTTTLQDCCDSGQSFVIEVPDHRLVAIRPLEPSADDDLTSSLLETNAEFRALVEKSRAGPRRPFVGSR